MPTHLIPGGMPTEAHVIVGEYADHLPFYRQAQICSGQGIDLDRSTLADRASLHAREATHRARSEQYAEGILKGFKGTLRVPSR